MIDHPQASVRDLQSLAPFPRTQLYHILEGLKSHGLVTSAKERARTRYIAEDPEMLNDLIRKQEQSFAANTNAMRALIPELKNQYRSAQVGGHLKTFVGVEKYRLAYEDILKTKPQTVYTFVHTGATPLPGVDIRNDIRAKMRAHNIQEIQTNNVHMEHIELHLYAGNILYTSTNDAEPVATRIEDTYLYTMQRNIFDIVTKNV